MKTVAHFDVDTLTEESKPCRTSYIKYHLHYSDGKYLAGFASSSTRENIQYLDDLELKVGKTITCTCQVRNWKNLIIVISKDTEKIIGLENCFVGIAMVAIL